MQTDMHRHTETSKASLPFVMQSKTKAYHGCDAVHCNKDVNAKHVSKLVQRQGRVDARQPTNTSRRHTLHNAVHKVQGLVLTASQRHARASALGQCPRPWTPQGNDDASTHTHTLSSMSLLPTLKASSASRSNEPYKRQKSVYGCTILGSASTTLGAMHAGKSSTCTCKNHWFLVFV